MGFKKVTGIRYSNFNELSPGDLLVDGYYLESFQGDLGMNYKFKDLDGEVYVTSGNHLGWLLDTYLPNGGRCKVFYEGKEKLTKGKFKGKEVKRFSLEIDDEEMEYDPKDPLGLDSIGPIEPKVEPKTNDSAPPWDEAPTNAAKEKEPVKENVPSWAKPRLRKGTV